MNKELLKLLQGVGTAVAFAIVQYLSARHPTLGQVVLIAVLTRVAGYGVAKLPEA